MPIHCAKYRYITLKERIFVLMVGQRHILAIRFFNILCHFLIYATTPYGSVKSAQAALK